MAATLSASGVANAFGSRPVRYVGLYLASSAGGLQVLDVLSERLGIPDRIFLGTIIVLVLGIPLVAAIALVLDTAASDRTPAGAGRGGMNVSRAPAAKAPTSGVEASGTGESAAPATDGFARPSTAASQDDVEASGHAPFALALVHHRLARMYDEAGQIPEAVAQYRRFLQLWDQAESEHRPLVARARERLDTLEGRPEAG